MTADSVATDSNKTLINRTIQGTTNQVNVNTSGTTTTFSTPQDIHTAAAPTFAGLTLNGVFTQNNNNKGFVIGELPGSAPGYASICHASSFSV